MEKLRMENGEWRMENCKWDVDELDVDNY